MLEGNIPTLEAPHKQPLTISNYEKWEKKRSLHLAARASATPLTQPPKSKVLNPVFRLQGDSFRLQARATSSISSPIICWCLALRTANLDTWMLHWRDNSKSIDQMIFTHHLRLWTLLTKPCTKASRQTATRSYSWRVRGAHCHCAAGFSNPQTPLTSSTSFKSFTFFSLRLG
jgi:hypothetical protein